MLRLIFVLAIVATGLFYSLQGPFYTLLFYLWNAYFRPEFWVWSSVVHEFRISLVVAVLLLISSLSVVGRFRFTRQLTLFLVFFLQSVVSLLAAEHPAWSMTHWIAFLKVAVVTVLITFLVSDEKRFRLTLLVIGLSLGFETAKQGWASMILNPGATNANPNPFLGDNNGVAHGVLMLIPLFVALAQTATKRWERRLHQVFIVGLVYRAISTYSRGGFVAAGVLAVITLWRSPRKVRAFIAMCALAAAVLSVMPETFWQRMDTITASEEERDESAQGRIHFWEVATRMVRAKPLTGVGFNGYRPAFATYDPGSTYGGDRAVHSAWFGVMAEMGYPGLILFGAIVVAAIVSCSQVKKAARLRGAPNLAIYAMNLQSSLLVYVTGATFLSAQYSEMFWHIFGLTIALGRIQSEALATEGVAAVSAPQVVPTPARPLYSR